MLDLDKKVSRLLQIGKEIADLSSESKELRGELVSLFESQDSPPKHFLLTGEDL